MPALIDLAKGWPSTSLIPASLLSAACTKVLSNPDLSNPALLYGPDPGYEPLREAIAAWLSKPPAPSWITANHVCITGGASQNLSCILQAFSDPSYTKNVYLVAPTYHLACRIFEDHGFVGRLKAVPEDDEGLDIDYLEKCLSHDDQRNGWHEQTSNKRPQVSQKHYKNIIYCVPTFANPTGRVMSLSRRQQLVKLARRYDALVVADDVYNELNWSFVPLPPRLVDIDNTLEGGPASLWGNVVSNGSFSKILGPGVRTGWALGTPQFIHGLSQCGSTVSGGAPSQFMAAVIAELLREGSLQGHIANVLIPTYSKRRRAALAAVSQYLLPHGVTFAGSATSDEVAGGYFVYVHLPKPLLAQIVLDRALHKEDLRMMAGNQCQVSGDTVCIPSQPGLRICIAWEDETRITEGIQRLGKVLCELNAERSASVSLEYASLIQQVSFDLYSLAQEPMQGFLEHQSLVKPKIAGPLPTDVRYYRYDTSAWSPTTSTSNFDEEDQLHTKQ